MLKRGANVCHLDSVSSHAPLSLSIDLLAASVLSICLCLTASHFSSLCLLCLSRLTPWLPSLSLSLTQSGSSALHKVCGSSSDHRRLAILLLDHGAEVNLQNKARCLSRSPHRAHSLCQSGSSPLHMASGSGQITSVIELLARGADVHLRDQV
jgi:hypothetical protein